MGWIRLSYLHAASSANVERVTNPLPPFRPNATLPLAIFANTEINFARDLQDRLGILALLALSAPFRICKLQIPLVRRETDPVSGHHLESMIYEE
jgi:hypothetical protein